MEIIEGAMVWNTVKLLVINLTNPTSLDSLSKSAKSLGKLRATG
jgi:hypothetical protein